MTLTLNPLDLDAVYRAYVEPRLVPGDATGGTPVTHILRPENAEDVLARICAASHGSVDPENCRVTAAHQITEVRDGEPLLFRGSAAYVIFAPESRYGGVRVTLSRSVWADLRGYSSLRNGFSLPTTPFDAGQWPAELNRYLSGGQESGASPEPVGDPDEIRTYRLTVEQAKAALPYLVAEHRHVPAGEPHDPDEVARWVDLLMDGNVRRIFLLDTDDEPRTQQIAERHGEDFVLVTVKRSRAEQVAETLGARDLFLYAYTRDERERAGRADSTDDHEASGTGQSDREMLMVEALRNLRRDGDAAETIRASNPDLADAIWGPPPPPPYECYETTVRIAYRRDPGADNSPGEIAEFLRECLTSASPCSTEKVRAAGHHPLIRVEVDDVKPYEGREAGLPF